VGERRAVVLGPGDPRGIARQLEALVAEGWAPTPGGLSAAATSDGALAVVGVFERGAVQPVAGTILAPGSVPAWAGEEPEAPACPQCGGRMLKRARKADGNPFWGCAGFPECRGIVSWKAPERVVEEARAQIAAEVRAQQPELPGVAPVGAAWMGDPNDNLPF
jgi:hypothetical protein